jgi:hypothetical protein
MVCPFTHELHMKASCGKECEERATKLKIKKKCDGFSDPQHVLGSNTRFYLRKKWISKSKPPARKKGVGCCIQVCVCVLVGWSQSV